MSFFRPFSDDPVARDYEGIALTEKQIYMINDYLDRVARGAFSHSYLTELRFLANRTFQKAVSNRDRDRMDQIGPELQVLDHVLHVAFDGSRPKPNLAPDPKHKAYLDYLNDQALDAIIATEEAEKQHSEQPLEEEMAEEEMAEEVADIVDAPISGETPLTIEGLSQEVISAFQPKSPVPQIAKIQARLENLVYEYRDAVADFEPPFIQKQILNQIAKTHERLESALDQLS